MATHDTKHIIHVVIVFKISDTDTSNLSLKLSKNIPVLSLTKTIKYSSNNESFLFRPGLLTISFWYFNVPSLHLYLANNASYWLLAPNT